MSSFTLPRSAPPDPSHRRGRRRARTAAVAIWIVFGLAVVIALYAILGYLFLPLGRLVHPDMRTTFQTERIAVYTHVFVSSVAVVIGPVQFLPAIRRRRPLHRILGRVYLVSVAVGGLSGLIMGFVASGGLMARVGYLTLAVVWLASGAVALLRILAGDVPGHRRWMVRNYALTFAGVMLRLEVAVASWVIGIPFIDFYGTVAWLCWVPNLVVAELINRRR